jgi:hypothetical protein
MGGARKKPTRIESGLQRNAAADSWASPKGDRPGKQHRLAVADDALAESVAVIWQSSWPKSTLVGPRRDVDAV